MTTIKNLLQGMPCGFGDRIIGELSLKGILQQEADDVNSAIDAVIAFEALTETREWLEGVRDYLRGQQCSEAYNRSAGYRAANDAMGAYISGLIGGKSGSSLWMLLKNK